MDLIEFLRRKLSPEDLALLEGDIGAPSEGGYDAVIQRVAAKLKTVEKQYSFARSRLELRSQDLLELPSGRRLTLLRSSSPVLLLVLYRSLIEKSYSERFGNRSRSLDLAILAVEIAEAVAESCYLSKTDAEDVLAEARAYLGNARRINSDMAGAEKELKRAEGHLARGSGDRIARADFLKFSAHLRVGQGSSRQAAGLLDREIALRRLLGDSYALAVALVDRGWVSNLIEEPAATAFAFFKAALPLVDDHRLTLQAVHSIAERLARDGKGLKAVKFLDSVQLPLYKVREERFEIQHMWIEGIACAALNELAEAENFLLRVRADLARLYATHKLAIASLDLACVYAAQGKLEEVKQLAEEAFSIFTAEGLEERALTAVVVLQEATEAERVTEGMAVAVANFLARFPYNKALRFDWKDE